MNTQANDLPQAYSGCTCVCHTQPGVRHVAPCCCPDPTRYKVGDRVVITDACIERMKSSNRSCVTADYPTQSFINKAMDCKGIVGEVTHTFPPGYEVTVQFPVGEGARAFHMKDNWIEAVND